MWDGAYIVVLAFTEKEASFHGTDTTTESIGRMGFNFNHVKACGVVHI